MNKSQLCRDLDMGWGTVSHHLNVLARQGNVVVYGVGKEVRIYSAGIGEKQARWLSVLGDGPAASIVDQLERQPGLRLVELSESIGVSRKVIRRHLTVLGEEGLVGRVGETQPRYHLSSASRSLALPTREGAATGVPRDPAVGDSDW